MEDVPIWGLSQPTSSQGSAFSETLEVVPSEGTWREPHIRGLAEDYQRRWR